MILKSKKADEGSGLPIGIIVIAIVLLVCLAIFLIWWFALKPIDQITITDCQNSIDLRDAANMATVAKVSILPVDSIPIMCKTEKICYSNKGFWDKVLNLLQPQKQAEQKKAAIAAGETWDCPSDFQTIPVSSQDDIIKDLTNRMALWWSVTGEGEKDYHSGKWISFSDTYCLLGEMIKFDSSIWNDPQMNRITYNKLWSYMKNTNLANRNINYFQYLYGTSSVDDVKKGIAQQLNLPAGTDVGQFAINTNTDQTILTGVIKQGHGKALLVGGAVALAVVAIVAAPVILPAIGGAVGGTSAAATETIAIGMEDAAMYDLVTYSAAEAGGGGTTLLGTATTAKLAGVGFSAGFILEKESEKGFTSLIPTIIPTNLVSTNKCENFDTLASPQNNST